MDSWTWSHNVTVNESPPEVKGWQWKAIEKADPFNGKAPKHLFTGQTPAAVVNSDFHTVFDVIAFCGIGIFVTASNSSIIGNDQTTTTAVFMDDAQQWTWKKFVQNGNVFVLDNVLIHQH